MKNHIKKHHKKYLRGSIWAYCISHIVVVKAVVIKSFLAKYIWTFMVIWLFSPLVTEGNVPKVCINGTEILPGIDCQISFDSLQDGISYLEKETDMEKSSIYNFQYHRIFQKVLQEHCNSGNIAKVDQVSQHLQERFGDKFATYPIEKRLEKQEAFYTFLQKTQSKFSPKRISDNTKLCQQKYLLHNLQYFIQNS